MLVRNVLEPVDYGRGVFYIYIFKLSERPRTASDARSARTRPAVQDVSSGSLSTSKEAFPVEGIIL